MTSIVRMAGLGLLALSASLAHAHSALTRDQVRQELADALRTGSLIAPGESGLSLRELNPNRFAAQTAGLATPLSKSRDEVLRELQAAQQAGELPAVGEHSAGPDGRALGAPPLRGMGRALTRAQVVADYREAARSGGLLGLGEAGQQTVPAVSLHR